MQKIYAESQRLIYRGVLSLHSYTANEATCSNQQQQRTGVANISQ